MRISRRDQRVSKLQTPEDGALDLSVLITPMVNMCSQCFVGPFLKGKNSEFAELRVPYLDELFSKMPFDRMHPYSELERRQIASEG